MAFNAKVSPVGSMRVFRNPAKRSMDAAIPGTGATNINLMGKDPGVASLASKTPGRPRFGKKMLQKLTNKISTKQNQGM